MLRPEKIAASGSEHSEQVALMQWVAIEGRRHFDQLRLLHAIPNGGDRRPHVGAKMKAEGVKSGVPDLYLPVATRSADGRGAGCDGFNGLYIEMKTPKAFRMKNNNCSPAQTQWHTDLLAEGYAVAVTAGWQAAVWVLVLYLRNQLSMPEEGPLLGTPVDNLPNF